MIVSGWTVSGLTGGELWSFSFDLFFAPVQDWLEILVGLCFFGVVVLGKGWGAEEWAEGEAQEEGEKEGGDDGFGGWHF